MNQPSSRHGAYNDNNGGMSLRGQDQQPFGPQQPLFPRTVYKTYAMGPPPRPLQELPAQPLHGMSSRRRGMSHSQGMQQPFVDQNFQQPVNDAGFARPFQMQQSVQRQSRMRGTSVHQSQMHGDSRHSGIHSGMHSGVPVNFQAQGQSRMQGASRQVGFPVNQSQSYGQDMSQRGHSQSQVGFPVQSERAGGSRRDQIQIGRDGMSGQVPANPNRHRSGTVNIQVNVTNINVAAPAPRPRAQSYVWE